MELSSVMTVIMTIQTIVQQSANFQVVETVLLKKVVSNVMMETI